MDLILVHHQRGITAQRQALLFYFNELRQVTHIPVGEIVAFVLRGRQAFEGRDGLRADSLFQVAQIAAACNQFAVGVDQMEVHGQMQRQLFQLPRINRNLGAGHALELLRKLRQ